MTTGTGKQSSNDEAETVTGDEAPPAVTVTVPVVAEPAPDDDADDAEEVVSEVETRVAAIETRIAELNAGGEIWQTQTTSTITSLQQEIADLKATLRTVGQDLPQQVQELRAELTRLSQELQAPETPESLPETDPPEVPPLAESPSGEAGDAPGSTENRPAPHQSGVAKKRRRVV